MATLSINSIRKSYGAVEVLNNIDIELEDGGFLVLLGPSGCGKSTLLSIIAGLEASSGGDIVIGDRNVNDVHPKDRNIAMVFQSYALYPTMSVRRNIGFGLEMRKVDGAARDKAVQDAADLLQIGHLLDRKPGQLSGGQRQRVAMGRAIVRNPDLFLFDEPLSNLDAKLRVEMRTQIKRLRELLQTTTVYVTHDQVEAMTLADRVVILQDGRIVQQGTPMEIYARPNCRFVAEFIGSPQMNVLGAVVGHADGRAVLRAGDTTIDAGDVSLADGTRVDVGIRPEHLAWAEPGRGRLDAVVDVYESLGSDTMAICLMGDQEITARLDPVHELKSKQAIHLDFDPANLHLFDAETGARIAA